MLALSWFILMSDQHVTSLNGETPVFVNELVSMQPSPHGSDHSQANAPVWNGQERERILEDVRRAALAVLAASVIPGCSVSVGAVWARLPGSGRLCRAASDLLEFLLCFI